MCIRDSRLHLTIDQSFKDRLAQAKRSTAAGAGRWSPISPCPPAVAQDRAWDPVCHENLLADLVGALGDGGRCAEPVTMEPTQHDDHGGGGGAAPCPLTTPADLCDLSAVDLLPFPADWSVALSDVDVDADFSDVRPPLPAAAAEFDWFFTDDQSSTAAFLHDFVPEPFPVYDDVIGTGDDAPLFDGVDDVWWSAFSVGQHHHAISVQ